MLVTQIKRNKICKACPSCESKPVLATHTLVKVIFPSRYLLKRFIDNYSDKKHI